MCIVSVDEVRRGGDDNCTSSLLHFALRFSVLVCNCLCSDGAMTHGVVASPFATCVKLAFISPTDWRGSMPHKHACAQHVLLGGRFQPRSHPTVCIEAQSHFFRCLVCVSHLFSAHHWHCFSLRSTVSALRAEDFLPGALFLPRRSHYHLRADMIYDDSNCHQLCALAALQRQQPTEEESHKDTSLPVSYTHLTLPTT